MRCTLYLRREGVSGAVVTEIWEGEVYSLPEEGGGKWW